MDQMCAMITKYSFPEVQYSYLLMIRMFVIVKYMSVEMVYPLIIIIITLGFQLEHKDSFLSRL